MISGATFGVYLIHEHVNLRYLWPTWFQSAEFAASSLPVFLLHMAGTVMVVYMLCSVIEVIRKKVTVQVGRCIYSRDRKKMMQ